MNKLKVITNFSENYKEDPICFFNFKSNHCKNFDLYLGINPNIKKILPSFLYARKKVYIELEEPNRFFIDNWIKMYREKMVLFDKIYTLCPYTSDFLNKNFYFCKKSEPIFFPFNIENIPESKKKPNSIIYSGILHTKYHESLAGIISSYPDYVLISFSKNPYATHVNISYKEKMRLYGCSKISVVSNILVNEKEIRIEDLRKKTSKYGIQNIEKNYAFNFLEEKKVMPQIKSRLFESAFAKCIILCQRDPFNLVENFFEPEKEFLYFDKADDLKSLIDEVLNNLNYYNKIANNAFIKACKNYTTDHLIQKINTQIN